MAATGPVGTANQPRVVVSGIPAYLVGGGPPELVFITTTDAQFCCVVARNCLLSGPLQPHLPVGKDPPCDTSTDTWPAKQCHCAVPSTVERTRKTVAHLQGGVGCQGWKAGDRKARLAAMQSVGVDSEHVRLHCRRRQPEAEVTRTEALEVIRTRVTDITFSVSKRLHHTYNS